MAFAAPWVIPCQDRANDTTSWPPVTSLAIRSAASFASAPVDRNRAFSNGAGSVAASRRASSRTGRLTIPL